MFSRIFTRLADAWAVLVGRKAAATPHKYPLHVAITYSVTEGKAPKDVVEMVMTELHRLRVIPPT